MFRVEVSSEDVVLEGGASGSKISISLTAQGNTEIVLTGAKQRYTAGNPPPAAQWQSYQFRLHEHRSLGWQPAVTSAQLLAVLANLTALRIRGAYTAPGEGFLDSVELETALVGTHKYYCGQNEYI